MEGIFNFWHALWEDSDSGDRLDDEMARSLNVKIVEEKHIFFKNVKRAEIVHVWSHKNIFSI